MARHFPHLVIDGFMPEAFNRRLLDRVLAAPDAFRPARVKGVDDNAYDPDSRESWKFVPGAGPLEQEFSAAIDQMLPRLLDELAIPAFNRGRTKIEIAAHRDGNFFRPHIDTFTDELRGAGDSDRIISAVYYFHRQPCGFTGGQIALHPLGPGDPVRIDPANNRLLAFPSFALHEVLPVACPGDAIADARFSINCWIGRARAPVDQ